MKKAILLLIILCFVTILNAQEEEIDTCIWEQTWMPKELLKCDTLNWSDYSEMYITQSDDKKITLLTFRTDDKDSLYYIHELRYHIAPNKIRSSSLQDFRFFSLDDYKSLIINKIYCIKDNTYLLEGINRGNEYFLMGIDVGRGIAQNAYLLPLEEEKLTNFISVPFDTVRYTAKEMKAKIRGERLRIPNYSSSQFAGEYVDYFFNGMHYEDSLSYANTIQRTENGEEIITRIYFKEENNLFSIDALYPKMAYSVVVTIASKDGMYASPVDLRLKNSGKDEHFEEKLYDVSMPLRVINGTVFVEGLDSYHFPIIKTRKWLKPKLKNVKYTAGRKFAYPHEWLRYSAVIFNRPIKKEEHKLVRWALEIDGDLQLLEGEEWNGTQIDLQMKKEWLDKTIKVIPYIEGQKIDQKIAVETMVVPYTMMISLPTTN